MATANTSDEQVMQYLQEYFDRKTGKAKDLSKAIKHMPIKAVITTLTNPAMPPDSLKTLKATFAEVVAQMPSSANPLTIALKKIFGASKAAPTAAKASAPTTVKKEVPSLAAMKKPAGPQVTSSGRVVKAPPASARGANLLAAELDDYRSSEDSDFDPNEHPEEDSSAESELESESEDEAPAAKPRPRALNSVKPKAKAVSVSSSSSEEEDSEEDSESEDSEGCSSTSEEDSEEEDTDLEEDNGPERAVLSDKESQELYAKTSERVQSERQKRNQKMFASWDLIIEASKGVKDEDIDAQTDAELAFNKMTDDWKCLKKIMKNAFGLTSKHTRVVGLPGPDPVILVDDQSEYAAIWLEPEDEGTMRLLKEMINLYEAYGVLFHVDAEKCPNIAKIKLKDLIIAGLRQKKASKGKKASK